jgi:hypothetical protein
MCKDAKLVFRSWIQYFRVQSRENGFAPNASILLHCTKNDGLDFFRGVSKPSYCKKIENFCVGSECSISGYWCGENDFTANPSILLHWTQNNVRECFGALRSPSAGEKMQNLCFRPECSISGYRSSENSFAPNASILLYGTKNHGLDYFRVFQKPL